MGCVYVYTVYVTLRACVRACVSECVCVCVCLSSHLHTSSRMAKVTISRMKTIRTPTMTGTWLAGGWAVSARTETRQRKGIRIISQWTEKARTEKKRENTLNNWLMDRKDTN